LLHEPAVSESSYGDLVMIVAVQDRAQGPPDLPAAMPFGQSVGNVQAVHRTIFRQNTEFRRDKAKQAMRRRRRYRGKTRNG
jgi:hypothetical protein